MYLSPHREDIELGYPQYLPTCLCVAKAHYSKISLGLAWAKLEIPAPGVGYLNLVTSVSSGEK